MVVQKFMLSPTPQRLLFDVFHRHEFRLDVPQRLRQPHREDRHLPDLGVVHHGLMNQIRDGERLLITEG